MPKKFSKGRSLVWLIERDGFVCDGYVKEAVDNARQELAASYPKHKFQTVPYVRQNDVATMMVDILKEVVEVLGNGSPDSSGWKGSLRKILDSPEEEAPKLIRDFVEQWFNRGT